MNGIVVTRTGAFIVSELGEPANYYKACGFRNPEGFIERAEWTIDGVTVKMFAKNKGKANTENTYEFPPPIDKVLYFGRCLLVNPIASLTVDIWNSMYRVLMGGFEVLKNEETESEDDYVDPDTLTKEGYEKDGFVVSDSELEEESYV